MSDPAVSLTLEERRTNFQREIQDYKTAFTQEMEQMMQTPGKEQMKQAFDKWEKCADDAMRHIDMIVQKAHAEVCV